MDEPPGPPEDPVAALVAQGLRDAEIAVRLGVGIDVAKARIAAVRAMGAPTANDPKPGPQPRQILPPEPSEHSDRGHQGAVYAAVVAAALAVVAFGAWLLLATGPGDSRAPAPGSAPAIAALPAGLQTQTLDRAAPVELPRDVSLVLKTEEGTLERLYRDDATLRRETLFTPPAGSSLMGAVADAEGWTLVAATYDGNATRFVRSSDGGVTWQEAGQLAGTWQPLGLADADVIARGSTAAGPRFARVSSGQTFAPPESPDAMPVAMITRGQLLWPGPGPLDIVTTNGTAYLSVRLADRATVDWAAPLPTGTGIAVAWEAAVAGQPKPETFAGLVNHDGELTSAWSGVPGRIAGLVDGGRIITVARPAGATSGDSFAPIMIDLVRGEWRPITDGLRTLELSGEDAVVAVRLGPFGRVSTPGAACQPVRVAPSIGVRSVGCLPDGAIVRAGDTRVHMDYTWRLVVLADARQGWIDASYIE